MDPTTYHPAVPPGPAPEGNPLAAWALTVAVAAVPLFLVPYVGPLLTVPALLAGLVLGSVALVKAGRGGPGRGMAAAAVVVAAVPFALMVLLVGGLFVVFALGGFE